MLTSQDIGQRIGEVVETSSTGFTAQAYDVNGEATLGSLVRTAGDDPVYAVVREVSTSSLDPGRRPVALGKDEESEEAVYRNNPQLSRLFRTDFDATIVLVPERFPLTRATTPMKMQLSVPSLRPWLSESVTVKW